ncbi:MAG: hypothetical protein ACO1OB_27665 [Archangium sp.]
MKRFVLTALCLLSSFAVAEDDGKKLTQHEETGQTWSVIGARTIAPGANLFVAEAGYPGLSVAYQRGIVSGLNLGGRVGFMYSLDGLVRDVVPGLKVQALLKFRFYDAGRISLGMTFEPGFFIGDSYLQGTRGGLNLPIGLRLGIAASSALAIGIQIEVPMWVEFGRFGGFNAPILSGGGAEYFITSNLTLFAKVRVGPIIRTGRATEAGFDASIGMGYRF